MQESGLVALVSEAIMNSSTSCFIVENRLLIKTQNKGSRVGVMVGAELFDNSIEVERYDNRMIKLIMVIGKKI